MAGLLLAPNPTADITGGVPWAPSYAGPQTTRRVTGLPATEYTSDYSRAPVPAAAPGAAGAADPGGAEDLAQKDNYVNYLQTLLVQSTGMERWKVEQQLADAQKGRDNAYKIAQLSADTSRYGVDAQSQTALQRLQQDAYQFNQNHGLELANAYTKYASTPDLTFQRGDLMEGLNRVGQGLGVQPYGSTGTPQPKTWEDFAALSGYGGVPAVQAGQSGGGASAGGGGSVNASGATQGGGGADPRVGAANGVIKALPPSDAAGHDQSDFAALNAIQSIYSASKPGSLQQLRPGQQAAFSSGLSRLGYYAPDALADMQRNAPGQTAVRSA